MEAWVIILLCVLIVPLWDHVRKAEAPEFEDYKGQLESMSPAQRAAAIGDLRDSARKSLQIPRYVKPDRRAMRETYARKERLVLRLAEHFDIRSN